jgi:hypothetical protein
MSPEDGFLAILKNFGVPTALGAAVIYSLRSALIWLGVKIVEPLMARQMRFFDDLDKAFDRQASALEAVCKTVELLRQNLHAQEVLLQRLYDTIEKSQK